MADDTDNIGPLIDDLAKYGVGAAGTAGANSATQAAYAAMLKNLQSRFADYSNLGPAGYQDLTAQHLGPSALSGIQNDAQSRADQQAAIAQLDDIAKSGGLELSDRNALAQIENKLSQNAGARNASLANQYAARGQLGGGQQLAMQLANNSAASQRANDTGENIAGQAQKRAMQAVLEKGSASRAMSNDDYARKKAAAEAADSIAQHNATMATDASKYNNTIKEQTYNDQLKKLLGQDQVTGRLNETLLGSGKQNANTIAGMTSLGGGLLGSLSGAASKIGKSGGGGGGGTGAGTGADPAGSNPDDWNQYPSSDETGGRGGAADISGGATDTTDAIDTAGAGDAAWSTLADDAEAFA